MNTHRILLRVLPIATLVVLAAAFWNPLTAWFTGKTPRANSGPPAVAFALPAAALEYSRSGFLALEQVRGLLARDTVEGVRPHSQEVASSFRAALEATPSAPPGLTAPLRAAVEAAELLSTAETLDDARTHFGQLSQHLVALASADPRLQQGWHIFQCPMATGFDKWFQAEAQMQNPYMGQRMLACGTAATWETGLFADTGAIAHYTCPMHPSVKSAAPGACPICGMDLTPVTQAELDTGVIRVDEGRRQRIGLTSAAVRTGPLDASFRALGRVAYDERALKDVTIRLDGYIARLRVDATGQAVKKGDVLFTLYSPELYAAQQEFLLVRSGPNEALARAARKRLELSGLTSEQIDLIAAGGEVVENVPFLSPATGYVIEKNVVEGAAVKAGDRLFRVAPLQNVWVEADVYEQDLPQVKVGAPVEVTLPYLPGKSHAGKVAFIYPALDAKTRTGKIRIELPNPDRILKPDMYASVRFARGSTRALQVPEEAVIYTGPRRLVFVDLGGGRLRPQEVKLGLRGERTFEVLEGLKDGDLVVTSGNFLIAAESRIRSAADFWNGASDAGR